MLQSSMEEVEHEQEEEEAGRGLMKVIEEKERDG